MLGVFEGIENGAGIATTHAEGIAMTHGTGTATAHDDLQAATTSSAAAAATTSTTTAPAPVRNDLPKRELTRHVDPLIGTEGYGHCISPLTV
jgi:hypothetical protein